MRKILSRFLVAGIILCGGGMSVGHAVSNELILIKDTVFEAGIYIDAPNIYVDDSLYLQNQGTVVGDIHVRPGHELRIQNTGTMSGTIWLGAGSNLIQVVRSDNDLTSVTVVDGPYTVMADAGDTISWGALYNLASGADNLVINDAEILFSNNVPALLSDRRVSVDIQGNLRILVDDTFQSGDAVMTNVNVTGTIDVFGFDAGPLYAARAVVRDDTLYIVSMRETDYYKILGNDIGRNLNLVRANIPDDALIQKLDAATSMSEINHILAHSVAIHPIRLSRPLRLLNDYVRDINWPRDASGYRGGALVISADEFQVYGSNIAVDLVMNNGISLFGGVYAGMIYSPDDVNVYDGAIAGAMGGVVIDSGLVKMRGAAGVSYAAFETPYVFAGSDVHTDIRGNSIWGVVDVVRDFDIAANLGIAPFVGAECNMVKIDTAHDTDIAARIGADVTWQHSGIDIGYEYGFGAVTNTSGNMGMRLSVGGMSYADMIGANVSIGVMRDDVGPAWTASVGVRAAF